MTGDELSVRAEQPRSKILELHPGRERQESPIRNRSVWRRQIEPIVELRTGVGLARIEFHHGLEPAIRVSRQSGAGNRLGTGVDWWAGISCSGIGGRSWSWGRRLGASELQQNEEHHGPSKPADTRNTHYVASVIYSHSMVAGGFELTS